MRERPQINPFHQERENPEEKFVPDPEELAAAEKLAWKVAPAGSTEADIKDVAERYLRANGSIGFLDSELMDKAVKVHEDQKEVNKHGVVIGKDGLVVRNITSNEEARKIAEEERDAA